MRGRSPSSSRRRGVVTLDHADRQLRRAKGQLSLAGRVPVIDAGNQLLRALHYGVNKRVGRRTFGGSLQRALKMLNGTGGCAQRFGLVRRACRLEHQGHQPRQRSFGE
jgi:hypothetical protein